MDGLSGTVRFASDPSVKTPAYLLQPTQQALAEIAKNHPSADVR